MQKITEAIFGQIEFKYVADNEQHAKENTEMDEELYCAMFSAVLKGTACYVANNFSEQSGNMAIKKLKE